MSDDQQLLRDYLSSGSPPALEELIRRHLPLVYSSALRQVKNAHLAEDITQAVFLVLTQKARTIRHGIALGGWLLSVTRFASVNAMKKQSLQKNSEIRAARPESNEPVANWDDVSPILDEVLNRLYRADRDAIVLRFFQDKTFAQIGAELGLSEEAARKRITRALEQMRLRLTGRHRTLTASALILLIGTHAVHAAPPTLSSAALAAGIASPSSACLSLATGAKTTMAWLQTQWLTAAAAVVIVTTSTLTFAIHALAAATTPPVPSATTQRLAAAPLTTSTAPSLVLTGSEDDVLYIERPVWLSHDPIAPASGVPIYIDARALLLQTTSTTSMDFRLGREIVFDPADPGLAAHTPIIDDWTRNILLNMVQADKQAQALTLMNAATAEQKSIELKFPEKDPLWTFTLSPILSKDHKQIVALLTATHNASPSTPSTTVHATTVAATPTPFTIPEGGTLLIDAGTMPLPANAPPNTPTTRLIFLIQLSQHEIPTTIPATFKSPDHGPIPSKTDFP